MKMPPTTTTTKPLNGAATTETTKIAIANATTTDNSRNIKKINFADTV